MTNQTSEQTPSQTTKTKIQACIKIAMQQAQKERLGVLRLMFSEIKNAEINHPTEPGKERPDSEVLQTLSAYHKSLAKSATEYPLEKQAPLLAELRIIEEFLPQKMSETELSLALDKELAQTEERNFGALMKTMAAKYGAVCDGKTLSQMLKQKIQS
jgi:uncharacterized protein